MRTIIGDWKRPPPSRFRGAFKRDEPRAEPPSYEPPNRFKGAWPLSSRPSPMAKPPSGYGRIPTLRGHIPRGKTPYRSWYVYNPDPAGEARPTVRRGSYEAPYVHPSEIIDQLRERFERQPVTYTTDPKTGKVIATKRMQKPEMPSEMRGARRFRPWFGEGELTSKWILPEGALTGPRFVQRQAPASDVQRQMGYRFGVSNIGQNIATVNPQTFWPSSAFKLPMREAGGGAYAKPEPVFGGTIDYTTGTWRTPPGQFGYADPYGRFEGARKTPPTIGAFRPARFGGRRRGGAAQQPEAPSAYTQSQRNLMKNLRRFYL